MQVEDVVWIPLLLWLWCRPVATALIRPLTWECPYAAGAALEKAESPKKKQKNKVNFEKEKENLPNKTKIFFSEM